MECSAVQWSAMQGDREVQIQVGCAVVFRLVERYQWNDVMASICIVLYYPLHK